MEKVIETREQILQNNFQAIRLKGFQGTRADKVVSEMGITKGALYHYFPTKLDLGYAIVDEIIAPSFLSMWKSVEYAENPLIAIEEILLTMVSKQTTKDIIAGCPLNNLMQEMSPIDEGFRIRLQLIINQIHSTLSDGLKKGQKHGFVKQNIDVHQSSFFILSSFEGAYGIAKTLQSKKAFASSIQGLIHYIHSLKP